MKFTVTKEFEITPEDFAYMFCEMSDRHQAMFFNEICRIARDEGWSLASQMQSVTDAKELNERGRDAMRIIGNYHSASMKSK